MSTLERLRNLLLRDFSIAPEALREDATLEDLEIDSLRMIEIVFTIEDEFKIAVAAEPAEIRARVRTLGDLSTYIDELLASRAAPA
jgi:acyl carrier protein